MYVLSDGIYALAYYIIGYRRKTVINNLQLVFPEKSNKELKRISKGFYKHMVDMFLEMIKSMNISKKQMIKRFQIKNPEEIKKLERLNRSIIAMYGHYASYEWSMVIEHYISYKGYGIYKKIKNPYFDKLAKKIRSKFNTELIGTKEAIEHIQKSENEGIKSITAFVSDQSPKAPKAHYRTNFMGINVPCHTGAEMLAKKLDLSVVYIKIDKVKRGFYEAEFIILAENARDYPDYEITENFNSILEKQIKAAPEYYLWTHKRWKHREPKVQTN